MIDLALLSSCQALHVLLATAAFKLAQHGRGQDMPQGPKGESRPADVIGAAVSVARLSVGLEVEALKEPSGRVPSGHAGARARASNLTPEARADSAKKAASARWE